MFILRSSRRFTRLLKRIPRAVCGRIPIAGNTHYAGILHYHQDTIVVPKRERIPIYQQENKFSCGPASIRMLLALLGKQVSEKQIKKRMGPVDLVQGTPQRLLIRGANFYLESLGFRLSVRSKISYLTIKQQLKQGYPLLHIYMSPQGNNPHHTYTMSSMKQRYYPHYVFLIGIYEKKRVVKLINPYGHIEDVPIDTRWKRISFHKQCMSYTRFRVCKRFRLLRPRTFFTLSCAL